MVIIFDGSQNQCEYAYRLRTGESGTEKPTKITAVLSGSSKFYLILTQNPKHHIHIPSKYSPSTIDLSKQMYENCYNDKVLSKGQSTNLL